MRLMSANLSMLFTERDFLERFTAAGKAGFTGVEYLFPYGFDADLIKQKLVENNLKQVLFNLPAGDWEAGERGIACHPERTEEFRQGVQSAIAYARVLGNDQVNCLAGIVPAGVSVEAAEAVFVENLRYAADKLQEAGIALVMEAINTKDIPGFFLNNTRQAEAIRRTVDSDNLYLQYDVYHMQIMEGDLARTIKDNLSHIRHIQVADNPGRNEPGTGEINYRFIFDFLREIGYKGWIGCEYKPAAGTEAGLGWLQEFELL